jgi:hypothetical protein
MLKINRKTVIHNVYEIKNFLWNFIKTIESNIALKHKYFNEGTIEISRIKNKAIDLT